MTDSGRTIVIGAGAAGIAAARRLHDAGVEVLLIEADDRLGGRARSVTLAALGVDVPRSDRLAVDLGCGWLHSATRNPWVGIAEAQGLTVDRSRPGWGEQWRDIGFPAAEQNDAAAARERWSEAAHAALGGPDRPLADFVATGDRWRPMLDAISGYANGAPLDAVSLHDWAAYEDAAGEENWTLPSGYGALVARHAAGLPTRLSTPVTRIDRRSMRLRIETASGTIEGARAIVCVPTATLDRIAFDPPLPEKLAAAAALPLGLADKVFLHVSGPLPWSVQAHLIGDPYSACTASHRLSPYGWPIIESFFGGSCAEALEGGDAATFAIDELVALLGSDWRRRLTPLTTTRWRRTPHIGGSYSHAAIGHAGTRAVLAEPVEDRLFFAGEACSPSDFSTAHGAYATGILAAEAVLALG